MSGMIQNGFFLLLSSLFCYWNEHIPHKGKYFPLLHKSVFCNKATLVGKLNPIMFQFVSSAVVSKNFTLDHIAQFFLGLNVHAPCRNSV